MSRKILKNCLRELVHLKDSKLKYEIIFVDDCSSDRSLEKIKSIAKTEVK